MEEFPTHSNIARALIPKLIRRISIPHKGEVGKVKRDGLARKIERFLLHINCNKFSEHLSPLFGAIQSKLRKSTDCIIRMVIHISHDLRGHPFIFIDQRVIITNRILKQSPNISCKYFFNIRDSGFLSEYALCSCKRKAYLYFNCEFAIEIIKQHSSCIFSLAPLVFALTQASVFF